MKLGDILREGDRFYRAQAQDAGMKDVTRSNTKHFRHKSPHQADQAEMRKQQFASKQSPEDQANMGADDQAFVDWLFQQGMIGGNTTNDLADLSDADANDLYRQFNRRGSVRSRYAQGTP